MALVKNVFTVGAATLASRVVGFLREVLMASMLGTGPIADAFVVAFRLPNLFRRLFAEGAFNAAFVPLFAKTYEADGHDLARDFAARALSVMFWWLLGFTVLAIVMMPLLAAGMAPGFLDEPGKFEDTVLFSRICFPYLMCMSLFALYAGVLNSLGRFAAAAWAQVLMNIVLAGALLLAAVLGLAGAREAAVALSIGVAVAGLVQLATVVWAAHRAGMRLAIGRPRLSPDVKRMFSLSVPGVIAGGITQINLVIGTMIASTVPAAVSWLYYADRLYQLPLGVVGIAIGVVLLPELARQLRSGDARVNHTQNRAFELAMLLTLPASVALAVIPDEIVGVLFQRGAFSATDTQATALALACFALGLPAFVLNRVFSQGFFAREDTKTPMKLAIVSVAVNVAGSLALFPVLGHVGIALATTIAGWVNALMLWDGLRRHGHFAWDAALGRRLGATAVASVAMGIALYGAAIPLAPYLDPALGFVAKVTALGVLCAGGFVIYVGIVTVLGGADHAAFKEFLRRRGQAPPAPLE